MQPEDHSQYAAYRDAVAGERMIPALRATVLVVIGATSTFPLLDWIAFPEVFWEITSVRIALAVSYACIWLWAPRAPEAAMLAAAFAEGLHLVAVIGFAGGVTSPYYPGIILLFLGMPILLPLTTRQAAWLTGPLFLLFAALPLLGATASGPRDYLISMFFVGCAAGVSVVGSFLLDRLRFQDHARHAEVTQARDQLAQLDQLKTRFSANVHHELRTPLTLLLAPLEGLRSGDYGEVDEGISRTFRTMHLNGQRLLKLINNLLDLAKLESKQFEIHRAPLELARLIEDIVEGAQPMAERKEIVLRTQGLASVPALNADGDALEKVIVNLLGNALKFTDAGGEIVVGVDALENGVEVYVKDSGVGLAADQLARVFDRFAQVDSSSTRKHSGTGIGLSLTQELVDLHAGRIWAESEGLGHGSTMRFFLPTGTSDVKEEELVIATGEAGEVSMESSIAAVQADLASDPAAEASATVQPGSAAADGRFIELERSARSFEDTSAAPETHETDAADDRPEILVTDDNADMRELISFILGRDFRVTTARNGVEALERLQDFEPDLIVSDIMMPEMSGTELCQRVKSDERLRNIPVMLVSSKAESEMKIEGLELGADDYVTKPFHPRELLARARSHAALHRTRRELALRNDELQRALHELQLAEAQLIQSERMAAVGELAAGVAHEVNNPVNYALNAVRALSAATEELREIATDVSGLDWDDPEKLASQGAALRTKIDYVGGDELASTLGELAKIVSDGLERTGRLVADLRDFAAPGSGSGGNPIDVREGICSTAQLLRRDLGAEDVELALVLPDELAEVKADPGALNQIFMNLIKNASDAFEGGGGRIEIEVAEDAEAGEVRVHVRDNGPGIDESVLERLFEPFFTTKPAGKGTGLGLSMCRKIADAHKGRIEVTSTLGQGSEFTLCLPVHEAGQSDEPGLDA